MRIRTVLVSGAAVAVPLTALGFGATAHAATNPTVSASTAVTDRLDSGFGGNNWASDDLTRTASVAEVAKDSTTTDCGPTATTCYTYKGTIKDLGVANAITTQTSPGAEGVAIKGSPVAAMKGTAYIQFHSSSNDAEASRVPATASGNDEATDAWVEQFFPAGTVFGSSGPDLVAWSWTYDDAKDCQTWLDANNIGKADSGDITGVDSCSTTIQDISPQSIVVGTPYSLQVKAATTSSDTSLTYSAKGLPDGLSINASTGLISGTPAADAVAGPATVTVNDFGSVAASTPITFSVAQATPLPVLSDGHATVTNNGATVTWKCSEPAHFLLTLTGPGPEDGKQATVSVPKAVYGGLESGHNYSVKIQPLVNGKAAGNPGTVTFKTTTGHGAA